MSVEIRPHQLDDKSVIWNLFQFYCYDTSREDEVDVEADGFFSLSPSYFGQYWELPRWAAHLIRVDGAIAGFVLIEPSDVVPEAQEIADLFILRRYRRRGLARDIVWHFLAQRQTPWTITVLDGWPEAEAFWAAMLADPRLRVAQRFSDPYGREGDVLLLDSATS